MKPRQILEDRNITLPFKLGNLLGSGVDGQVFEDLDCSTKVIKLSILHTPIYPALSREYERVFRNLDHLFVCKPSHFATIYSFGELCCGCLDADLWNEKPYLIHYVEMERLLPLSEDETKVIHTLLSHEDANKRKPYNPALLNELSSYLTFNRERMDEFCRAATSGSIIQRDLHPRNIMKRADGSYAVIDLDRLELR